MVIDFVLNWSTFSETQIMLALCELKHYKWVYAPFCQNECLTFKVAKWMRGHGWQTGIETLWLKKNPKPGPILWILHYRTYILFIKQYVINVLSIYMMCSRLCFLLICLVIRGTSNKILLRFPSSFLPLSQIWEKPKLKHSFIHSSI